MTAETAQKQTAALGTLKAALLEIALPHRRAGALSGLLTAVKRCRNSELTPREFITALDDESKNKLATIAFELLVEFDATGDNQ